MPRPPRPSLEALLLLALAGCHHALAPPTSDDLTDVTVQLEAAPGLRLAFDSHVQGRPARVLLEVSALRSTATLGCFDGEPEVLGQARVAVADGTSLALSEVDLSGLELGPKRWPPLRVGLVEGAGCEVTLGNDVLSRWALELALVSRTLTFRASQPRQAYAALAAAAGPGREVALLEVSREPRFDWPLLVVRVRQGEAELVAPFVLATSRTRSQVSVVAAASSALKRGLGMFDGLPLPEGLELPSELRSFQGVAFDALELAPGFGVERGSLKPDEPWSNPSLAGSLGGDVWGRFDLTLDVQAGVLLVSRPRVLTSGTLQRCSQGEALGEDRCFALDTAKTPQGLRAAVTVWRSLPSGGRLLIDLTLPDGESRSGCRVGVSFAPQDRGASSAHLLPWPRMSEALPRCAEVLRTATGATLAAFEESPLDQCPGTCGFVQDLKSRQVSCECQQGAGSGEAERRLLELYRLLLERQKLQHQRALEPADH